MILCDLKINLKLLFCLIFSYQWSVGNSCRLISHGHHTALCCVKDYIVCWSIILKIIHGWKTDNINTETRQSWGSIMVLCHMLTDKDIHIHE
jgi:hypothetical protein